MQKLLLPLVALCAVADQSGAATKPNFVIILADDMGYGDASCYGNTRYKTPHLDKLAAEGLRFLDFHSSGTVCSPTRAGLLTGRYQQRAGIPGVVFADPKKNRHHGLQAMEHTFAEALSKAGYATGMCGKWHVGYRTRYNPTNNGFDSFRGYVSGNVDYFSHYDQAGVHDWWHNQKNTPEEGYSTHLITRHAVDFINRNKEKPFCLYVAHEAPHYPYQGPRDKPIRSKEKTQINNANRKDVANAYREMMQEMDKGIGEIVATLKKHKLHENTLVFFFSDNGANNKGSNGKLRGFKGSLWEGGHRVPAIACWPKKITPGTTSETGIGIDLMPTMLELAGIPFPKTRPLDGVSLVPVFQGKALKPRTLFWEFRGLGAVRQGKWKLVETGPRNNPKRKKLQLFDLQTDPGEKTNVAAKNAERVREMKKALADWRTEIAATATRQPAK